MAGQTWPQIQLIVVDDQSTDESPDILRRLTATYPHMELLLWSRISETAGLSIGLAPAKGEFVIDLAADDLLEPERIARGVALFGKQRVPETGIQFSDAILISPDGKNSVATPTGSHTPPYRKVTCMST